MKNIASIESDNDEAIHWSEVIERLDDEYDSRRRNVAMTILHEKLTPELLESEPDIYLEGAKLAIRGAKDSNYTVRDYASYILWQILQDTEETQDVSIQELYGDVYKTMKDLTNDTNKRVKVTAKDILWVYNKEGANS